jgi:hypothetical protein
MLKHLLPVTCEMFGVENRQFNVIFTEQVEQCLLAFDLWQLAQVLVAPEQVEGVIDQPVLSARRELCLQFGKVRTALVNDDDVSVDDGFTRDVRRSSDLSKSVWSSLAHCGCRPSCEGRDPSCHHHCSRISSGSTRDCLAPSPPHQGNRDREGVW